MKLAAFIDTSSFIWDINHYEANRPSYYDLMLVLPNILEKLKLESIPVVMRHELFLEINAKFPFSLIPNAYKTFSTLTLRNLSNLKRIDYSDYGSYTLICTPEFIKEHFENSTKNELKNLDSYIFNSNGIIHKLLTFGLFWGNNQSMTISNGNEVEVEVSICDDNLTHDSIVDSLKKKFEHNPKHNKYKSSNYSYYNKVISPLTCYNERIGDTTEAQRLLDASVYYNGDFFNLDENNTIVIFVHTLNNVFHGFNISPSENDIKKIKAMLR